MTISILSLFPEFFTETFSKSIIGNAVMRNIADIKIINIRDFSTDRHKSVDDRQYGGGKGMILRPDIVYKALVSVKKNIPKERTVLLDPTGYIFSQKIAESYSKLEHLILISGHYEGIDYRINSFVDDMISIGDYILTGGEIPAMVITDATIRLIEGVLPQESRENESFSDNYLFESPQYTRPENFRGLKVPAVLKSGNHEEIKKWRLRKSKNRKRAKKPVIQ